MQKTLHRWLLFSSALLSVAACQEIPSTVPSQERATQATEDPYNLSKVVLREYLDARLSGNWARSYELVVTDKTQEVVCQRLTRPGTTRRILGPASTFQILDLTVNREYGRRDCANPDARSHALHSKAHDDGCQSRDAWQTGGLWPRDGRAVQSLESRQFELVEQTQRFTLIKVKGKWRVDLMSAATNRQ